MVAAVLEGLRGTVKQDAIRGALSICRQLVDRHAHLGVEVAREARHLFEHTVLIRLEDVGRIHVIVEQHRAVGINGHEVAFHDDGMLGCGLVLVHHKLERLGILQRLVVIGEAEVTALAPAGAPAVAHDPSAILGRLMPLEEVLLGICVIPAHDGHAVVGHEVFVGILCVFGHIAVLHEVDEGAMLLT